MTTIYGKRFSNLRPIPQIVRYKSVERCQVMESLRKTKQALIIKSFLDNDADALIEISLTPLLIVLKLGTSGSFNEKRVDIYFNVCHSSAF